jgi:hypothetical protein
MSRKLLPPSCLESDITVEIPSLPAGGYKMVVTSSEFGTAINTVNLSYQLHVNDVSPSNVGVGGGTRLAIGGSGFSADTKVG